MSARDQPPSAPAPATSSDSAISISVLYPTTGPFDAIAQHGDELVAELARRGMPAQRRSGGARALARRALARAEDWIALEYLPYAYGRRGIAPGLVLAMMLVRALPGAPRVALLVHESAVEREDLRTWVLGSLHRLQLAALARLADVVLASTEANLALVRELAPRASVIHTPSPSNVPCSAECPKAARARLGIGEQELAIALFGGRHWSRAIGHAEAAIAAVARDRGRLVVINLGAEAAMLSLPAGVRLIAPGPADAADLSAHLAAADIYLAPFRDGTSTRRTTFSAALAHALPVVGTDGAQTDALLRRDPQSCLLVPVADVSGYAAVCAELAREPARREALGRAGRALYERSLSWEAVGARVAAALAARREQPR